MDLAVTPEGPRADGPLDPEATFRVAPRRVRFADATVEARFASWHVTRSIPFIRVGMAVALLGGWVLIAAGWLFDPAFSRSFQGAVLQSSPGFVVALAATWSPTLRRWLFPLAAIACLVWGAAMLWGSHRALAAPELGSIAVILVMFFGFLVFRLPLVNFLPVIVALSAFHVSLLVGDATTDIAGGGVFHVAFTCAVLVASALVGFVNDRVERTQFRQAEIISTQAMVIASERARADALLRNVLPEAIAERLKGSDGTALVDRLDGVTVLFADIVGFTRLVMQLRAEDAVAHLDHVFTRLDELAERHGVEKIKTVGDAYMAVAGAPEPREDHVEVVACLALDIIAELATLSSSAATPTEMRIGIATGHAVAGVIGRKRFAYDLWSDTVNMAARMESHGVPGRVQVTEEVASRLRGTFHLEERGIIDIKGKGPTRTWFLEGALPATPPGT